jgi:hypothetical protein
MTTDTPNPRSGSEESHVERASLGPTPDNPSLSLKTRLKRAAFFDRREREVAAGEADPIDPEAGLRSGWSRKSRSWIAIRSSVK